MLLVGGAFHDRPEAGWALLIAGFACAARWLAGADYLRRAGAAGVLLLLACLGSALGWQTAHRRALRLEAARFLPLLQPPDRQQAARLEGEIRSALAELEIRRGSTIEQQDLAFTLWRSSPLARRNALSALAVVADGQVLSSFSFGLPIAEGDLDREPGRWEALHLPGWDETLVAGEATPRGARDLRLRFWILPRPGFLLGGLDPGDVELALLRSDPAQQEAVAGLPGPLQAGLYSADGRALRSPWRESPPMPAALRGAVDARVVATPSGDAWAIARRSGDGFDAVFLPLLTPRVALDQVGTQALSAILLLGAAALLALLLGLPRAAFRDALARAVRSYSKRLILVFTLLVLVPLLLFNAALVRGFEDRLLRQQRAAGEAAITAAQRVLGEYVLTLEPGFSLGTALDDRLLVWLASVVHRDVSLYWGSSLYASSRRELFTAGVLPRRIPGEMFERLSLLGYGIAARVNRAGGARYLEMYAPLRVPGAPAGEGGLALSVPLLAQQEEATAELERLRRQAILGTAAMFLLLLAIGTRLARNFTRPLMELVRGTQRIAAGASSLDVQPEELELQALAEAIDRMAGHIAEGRSRLLREKQVVERVVENITAGVVSLDADRRIVMTNRVAGQMLGVLPGERLPRALAAREELRPVAEFLERAGSEPRQATVRIGAAPEQEWTLIWAPVPGSGEPAALLVVEDATEVLRGQRLEAWAEMARIIAHEIKNPLTPIRLSAEHMREVYANAPERFTEVFERCTANILRQVEELRDIASEFSAYSRIPRLDPQPGDLVQVVAEVVEAYAAAPPAGAQVEMAASEPSIPARFDAKLLGRAVRNLLENALRACGPNGRVDVTVERRAGEARIAVADSGPGVPAAALPRIFDPYFSTHASGTGLGLPIARRIVEEHGGRIEAGNRAGGGFEVAITMPLS
jgi:signal transduction histidine kinase/HAMP domain-containing protein